MKALILAAGRGSRLGKLTDKTPKSMLHVDHRPILHHAVDRFRAAGITDIAVVRGYQGDKLSCPGVRWIDNLVWQDSNVLWSIFAAKEEISGEIIICYSDIIFEDQVLKAALKSHCAIQPVVDITWRDVYIGRDQHPVSEADKVKFRHNGSIAKIGKSNISGDDADGEFIGMLYLNSSGARRLSDAFTRAMAQYDGKPFQAAAIFRNAYLTDLLQHMIDKGEDICPSIVQGGWREVDTAQDLERAKAWFGSR